MILDPFVSLAWLSRINAIIKRFDPYSPISLFQKSNATLANTVRGFPRPMRKLLVPGI